MAQVGRPPKLSKEQRQEVFNALKAYIIAKEDPTIVGFVSTDETALTYDVTDDNINDWSEFSILRKRAFKKCEYFLLTAGGANRYNPTMAIFRLKQPVHGYSDKIQQENSGEQTITVVTRKHESVTDDD